MLVACLKFAESYYSKRAPAKKFLNMLDAVAPLKDLYGDTLADEFGPLKLKAVRKNLIDRKLCRTEIKVRQPAKRNMASLAEAVHRLRQSVVQQPKSR